MALSATLQNQNSAKKGPNPMLTAKTQSILLP